jgi:death on curing protein
VAEITFLSLGEVLEIHRDQIARYGGSPGLRDLTMLKSALGMPQATFGGVFLHTDIFEMAAAYIFHIVKNHPFINGNKRTGVVSAIVFMALNGYDFAAPQNALAEAVCALAAGELAKVDVAILIRKWAVRSE